MEHKRLFLLLHYVLLNSHVKNLDTHKESNICCFLFVTQHGASLMFKLARHQYNVQDTDITITCTDEKQQISKL